MLLEVSNLLFKNTINPMMKIMNEVVEELFRETYNLFEQKNNIIQYVKGQRQKRSTQCWWEW